jgi:hypothetical protein
MALDLAFLGIRHQVMLEGLKADRANRLFDSILEISNALQDRLRYVKFDNLGDMRKTDLTLLLMDLRNISTRVFNQYLVKLIQWLNDYINADREFWQYALSEYQQPDDNRHLVILPFWKNSPKADAIYSFAKNNPMGANGALMEDFARGFGALMSGRVAQQAAKSYANIETKAELIDALTGGKPTIGKPKRVGQPDGLLNTLARQGDAMQRTIIQHVAAATNMKTAGFGFAQYLWVSVLDSHTTVICQQRDGNVYTYGEGPEPPAHIGCRSSTVPFDGTAPISMPSFTVWANGQSQEFLNAAFDGEVGSAYGGNARAIDLETFTANRSLIIA